MLLFTYKCQHPVIQQCFAPRFVLSYPQLYEQRKKNERFIGLSFKHCLKSVCNKDAFSLGIL